MKFTISGRVQGVGFRSYVQSIAYSLELKGEVYNERGGGVSGCVFGPSDALAQFYDRLWQGPGLVRSVDLQSAEDCSRYQDFEITRTR